MKYLLVLLIPLIFTNCKPLKDEQVKQGVSGTVLWFEGNLMPGPGTPAPKGKPIQRTILICELTNVSEVSGDGPLYTSIKANIIKEVSSDKNGKFQVKLPAGKYSLFVKEDSQYFANSFDAKNNVGVLTVEKDQLTEVKIDVNYKASY